MPATIRFQTANQIARMFVADTVDGRRDEAMAFLAAMERAIELGMAAGADNGFLLDTARGTHDAISNIVGKMRKALDNEGIEPDGANIDTASLDSLIGKLERAAHVAKLKGYQT